MKYLLRKWIRLIRSFLDRAEASLDETQQNKNESILAQTPVQEESQAKEKSSNDTDILVPFSKGNPSGAQSTYKDRKTMNALLDEWIFVSGIEAKQAKSTLRKHADVHRIDYMTIGQVEESCEWLREKISQCRQK